MNEVVSTGVQWSPGTPREIKKQAKLKRISDVAWRLFQSEGFEATTTRAVADAAGVASGTLFLYARDKNDLLVLAFRGAIQEVLDAALGTVPSGKSFVQNVMHVLGALAALHDRHKGLAGPFVKEWLTTGDARQPMTAVINALLGGLASLVADAQKSGEIDVALAPADVAATCLGLYHATLVLWLGGWLHGEAPEAYLRRQVTLLTSGLSAPKGTPRAGERIPVPRRVTIFGDNDEFVD